MSVAILGGGISGLASAYYLKSLNANFKVVLIEGTNRLGGWINTHITADGTQYEVGPRSLRVSGGIPAKNTLQLAESLNLFEKIKPIHVSHPSARNRWIKVNENLYKLPNSFKDFFKQHEPFSKSLFKFVLKDLFAPKFSAKDDSIYNFVERRVGTEIAKYIIDPGCRGIFAGNAKDLSVNNFAKESFNLEQKYGSVIKGLILESFRLKSKNIDLSVESELGKRAIGEGWSVWSLEGGLSTLVTALENDIKNHVKIYKSSEISQISFKDNKMIVSCRGEKTFEVDKVISCLPAHSLYPLISNINEEASQLLGSIPFVDVAVVNLEYKDNIVKEPGFGYLIPSCEGGKVLGVIYDSDVFPNKDDSTIMTVMMGGRWFETLFGRDPSSESLLDIATNEIRTTFGTNASPCSSKVSILRKAIPQYTVGHLERVRKLRRLLENVPLYLAGNSYDGVGINDAIYSSKKIVSSLIK